MLTIWSFLMARKPGKSTVSKVEDESTVSEVEDEINASDLALKMLNKKKAELVALKLNWTNTKSGHDRMLMEPRIRELELATR